MIQRKHKATAALVFSAIGFVGTYAYSQSFWGGLFHSACIAAMIGGLADWFAVTALFRRPLGISYRTEVIPRNRQRILNEMVEFICRDILTPEHIMKVVRQYDLAQMMILYLEDAEGKQKSQELLRKIVSVLLQQIDTERIGKEAEALAKARLAVCDPTPVVSRVVDHCLEKKYDERIAEILLDEGIWIFREPATQEMLTEIIATAKERYEENLTRRRFLSFIMDLTPEKLSDIVRAAMIANLEKLRDPQHEIRVKLKLWLMRQAEFVKKEPYVKEWLLKQQNEKLMPRLHIAGAVTAWLDEQIARRETETGSSVWLGEIDRLIERKLALLKESESVRQELNRWLLRQVEAFVRQQHDGILKIVNDRIAEFSDESLTSFIESRVESDLQMIRINGSIVGAFAGMAMYVLTYFVESLWWLK